MHDRRLNVHPLPQLVAENALAGQHGGGDRSAAGDDDDLPGAGVGGDGGRAVSGNRGSAGGCRAAAGPRQDRARRRAGRPADRGLRPGQFAGRVHAGRRLAGRRVFFTTTNGTRALDHARLARRVLVGVVCEPFGGCRSLFVDESRIDILCAGTDGEETREDILAAGAMVDATCISHDDADWQTERGGRGGASEMAERSCEPLGGVADRSLSEYLAAELRDTLGGRNLLSIGMERDLAALREDRCVRRCAGAGRCANGEFATA